MSGYRLEVVKGHVFDGRSYYGLRKKHVMEQGKRLDAVFGAYLGLRLPAVQRVEVVHGALGGRQRVREDLEDVEVMAQGVCRNQQHACHRKPVIILNQLSSRNTALCLGMVTLSKKVQVVHFGEKK